MSLKTKQKRKIALIIIGSIIGVMALLACIFALISYIGVQSNLSFISKIETVEYENQLTPVTDNSNYDNYTFITDDDFKIMQLTDVHIGAGFLSIKKDSMAINAVAAMITEERPDLVIVTGDIAYPIPFQSGTFNNKNAAVMFAELMEQLGVYWCPVFGNHDTESYSYYSRETIGALYSSDEYPHCLFQAGPDDIDGCGNYIVNVKNSQGEIMQSLIMLDSNDYINGSIIGGITWNYDCIHENQVEWYQEQIAALTEKNGGETPKSLVFFHIPLIEFRDAWYEYADNRYQDSDDVKYIYGKAGEQGLVIYSSELNSGLFDTALELGSTQGFFCGHDHLNNFSIEYKGIRLTYGYSIDYLAYTGIMKYGTQRGCTMITVSQDGSYTSQLENYYQDKYVSVKEKEQVSMDDYYSDDE